MLIDHLSYDIPGKVGPIKIRSLAWTDFKGTPPENSPYLAHIYWIVNYEFQNFSTNKPKVKVTVSVRPKSWTKQQKRTLLKHQYGHYLIGCLCGLSFAKKANYDMPWNQRTNFGLWCRQILGECLKQYCEMQIQYDNQTHHYLNQQKQMKWQKKIRDQFLEFDNFFKSKKQQQKSIKNKISNQINQKNQTSIQGLMSEKLGNFPSKHFTIKREVCHETLKSRKKEQIGKKSLSHKLPDKRETYTSNISMRSIKRYFKKLEINQTHNQYKSSPNKASLVMRSHTTDIKPL